MKLYAYSFASFVQQDVVPYEYASISLVAIEASMWLLLNCMTVIDKLRYPQTF